MLCDFRFYNGVLVFVYSFFVHVSLEMSLFPRVFVQLLPFSLIISMESTSYVLPFRVVFFCLVATGLDF